MLISLTLETDMLVRLQYITILQQAYTPFYDICDVETYEEEFYLLQSVYIFMVTLLGR